MRYGMVIDLTRCASCYACQLACKIEHFLPPGIFWGRVIVGETGEYPAVRKVSLPVLCNHCKEAACVDVCPTGATKKREDGIVKIDYDECMGCRYCLIACPYQARTFYTDDKIEYNPGQGFTPLEEIGHKLYQPGTVVKCDFCRERVDTAVAEGLKPGVDWDATPACVNICYTKARTFGDLDDPESEISRLIREKKGFQLHPEHGTDPSVYYLQY